MNIHQWHKDTIGQKTVAALKKNEFDAVYFSTKEEAVEHILSYINSGAQVGFGGSMTISQDLALIEKVKDKGAVLLVHGDPQLTPAERLEVMRKQQVCDVFVTSTNAVTLDGCLVNMDGVGNRVAALTFGPRKVVVVVGTNKICQDVDAAVKRLQTVAAPKNSKRLNTNTPCTVTGICADCHSSGRICKVLSIMKRKPSLTDITVVVVGEDMGY